MLFFAFFFSLGGAEILIILAIIALLFGAKKVPEIARKMGEGVREVKKIGQEVEDQMDDISIEVESGADGISQELERPFEGIKKEIEEIDRKNKSDKEMRQIQREMKKWFRRFWR